MWTLRLSRRGRCFCHLSLSLARFLSLLAIPGLRGRLKVTENATTANRPRSVHFPEGLGFRNRESAAPPGNDLDGLRHQPRCCRRSDRRGFTPSRPIERDERSTPFEVFRRSHDRAPASTVSVNNSAKYLGRDVRGATFFTGQTAFRQLTEPKVLQRKRL